MADSHFISFPGSTQIFDPWPHWIADNFLSPDCLAELKGIEFSAEQAVPGIRRESNRLFVDENNGTQYPHLYALYLSLHEGVYKEFFEDFTGQDYTGLYPRVEVISDTGEFFLAPHHDHLEKRLTAMVYTDYQELYPGTTITDSHTVPSADNRCWFFVPEEYTVHEYEKTTFTGVRRALQINYWTYQA